MPDDLLVSTDKNFRPVDPQIGPDGAHLVRRLVQRAHRPHAVLAARPEPRPPARPHLSLVYTKKKPLRTGRRSSARPSRSCSTQLREYELRTRYRARRELRDRPTELWSRP